MLFGAELRSSSIEFEIKQARIIFPSSNIYSPLHKYKNYSIYNNFFILLWWRKSDPLDYDI